MIKCPACATPNDDSALFCSNLACRTYLAWETAAAEPEPAPARAPDPVTAPGPEVGRRETSPEVGETTALFVGVHTDAPQGAAKREIAVGLLAEPASVEVEAGSEAMVELRVHNGGTVVDCVTLSLEGAAAAWGTVEPGEVTLYPGDTAVGAVTFRPPRSPDTPAGATRVALRAVSGEDPAVSATQELVVKVRRFYELATEEVAPREAKTRRCARYAITVTNVGNASVEPSVRMVDTNETLHALVDPDQDVVSPGRSRTFAVRVTARRRMWFGSPRPHPFQLHVSERDTDPQIREARLVQEPIIATWAAKVLAALGPALVALIAFLVLWTSVPQVEGLTAVRAAKSLETAGFEVEVKHDHSKHIRAGRVIGTDPPKGARIREGSGLVVHVSAGNRPTIVPNVLGLPGSVARSQLVASGLVVEEEEKDDPEVAPGAVVGTEPAANLLIPPGGTVKMLVAPGGGKDQPPGKPDPKPEPKDPDPKPKPKPTDEPDPTDPPAPDPTPEPPTAVPPTPSPTPEPPTPTPTPEPRSEDSPSPGASASGGETVAPSAAPEPTPVPPQPTPDPTPVPSPSPAPDPAPAPKDKEQQKKKNEKKRVRGGPDPSCPPAEPRDPPAPYWHASVASNDFDGDGAADLAMFDTDDGTWRVRYAAPGKDAVVSWAEQQGTDIPVPGDYDGDGKADLATWRPSNGTWYIRPASGKDRVVQLGDHGDIPAPADYDGDGTTDLALFEAHDGNWIVRPSSGDDVRLPDEPFGDSLHGDVPVAGDYDGDGKAEAAFYRSSTAEWHVWLSTSGPVDVRWGHAGDPPHPVPGDYDGDGRFDYAVWDAHGGIWKIKPSNGGETFEIEWGDRAKGDHPVAGDYTRDGTWDYAVWRETTGQWRVKPADGTIARFTSWGKQGDTPL